MEKRFADWLEKISVGFIVVALLGDIWKGFFIKSLVALVVGISAFCVSMYLTINIEDRE